MSQLYSCCQLCRHGHVQAWRAASASTSTAAQGVQNPSIRRDPENAARQFKSMPGRLVNGTRHGAAPLNEAPQLGA